MLAPAHATLGFALRYPRHTSISHAGARRVLLSVPILKKVLELLFRQRRIVFPALRCVLAVTRNNGEWRMGYDGKVASLLYRDRSVRGDEKI